MESRKWKIENRKWKMESGKVSGFVSARVCLWCCRISQDFAGFRRSAPHSTRMVAPAGIERQGTRAADFNCAFSFHSLFRWVAPQLSSAYFFLSRSRVRPFLLSLARALARALAHSLIPSRFATFHIARGRCNAGTAAHFHFAFSSHSLFRWVAPQLA